MTDRGLGQVISAMARAGVFRLGGTLIGTQAFRCYEGALGLRIGLDQSAMTDDVDIASFERLSIVLEDQVDEPLTKVFRDLSFDPLPSLASDRAADAGRIPDPGLWSGRGPARPARLGGLGAGAALFE